MNSTGKNLDILHSGIGIPADVLPPSRFPSPLRRNADGKLPICPRNWAPRTAPLIRTGPGGNYTRDTHQVQPFDWYSFWLVLILLASLIGAALVNLLP